MSIYNNSTITYQRFFGDELYSLSQKCKQNYSFKVVYQTVECNSSVIYYTSLLWERILIKHKNEYLNKRLTIYGKKQWILGII